MSKTPEGAIKAQVCEYLDGTKTFYRKMQSGVIRKGSRFIHLCPEGTADILAFRANHPVWIELKDANGRTQKSRKAAQAAFADEVRALGHTYALCESLDDVIAALSGVTIREI